MMAILKKAVARANAQLAGFEKVRKFIVASEDFTIEKQSNDTNPKSKASYCYYRLSRSAGRPISLDIHL